MYAEPDFEKNKFFPVTTTKPFINLSIKASVVIMEECAVGYVFLSVTQRLLDKNVCNECIVNCTHISNIHSKIHKDI